MPDKRTPAEEDADSDATLLSLLMDDENHRPWSVGELACELRCDPADSLNRLFGVGLIHRAEGFVWASRAAVRAEELSR